MPSLLVALALFVVGVALTVGGYLFFEEAFALLGLLVGLSVGITALGNEAIPGQWDLAVLVVAPLVGLALAVALRTVLVAVLGAAIGFAVGLLLTGASLATPTSLLDPLLGVCLLLGVAGAFLLKTPIFMVASAGWGSTLLCLALGIDPFTTTSLQAGAVSPTGVNVAFHLVGIVVQVGLWYYLRQTLDDDETLRGVIGRRAGRRYEAFRN